MSSCIVIADNCINGEKTVEMHPFLKWAGGKRWLVQSHSRLIPKRFNTYFEPFLGAGSVFFHLQPRKAVLADINSDLISAYLGVRSDWRSVSNGLRYRQRAHDRDDKYYYRIRARTPTGMIERATRFIYLNRTCFNGIYRVN